MRAKPLRFLRWMKATRGVEPAAEESWSLADWDSIATSIALAGLSRENLRLLEAERQYRQERDAAPWWRRWLMREPVDREMEAEVGYDLQEATAALVEARNVLDSLYGDIFGERVPAPATGSGAGIPAHSAVAWNQERT